ncbi:MAG: diguanylate cyclase, partial [Candidatus Limnocylindria bacterium]
RLAGVHADSRYHPHPRLQELNRAMELRSLLQILVNRWWIIVPTFLITIGIAGVLALSQRPAYEASSTLLVTPGANVGSETLSALAVISRQTEITDTYAQIASSRSIQKTAADALSLTGDQRRDVRLISRLVTGTTLVSITARSSSAELSANYANAVSDALVDYVNRQYDVFALSVLDPATTPHDGPVSPNVPLTLGLGGVAGLMLGIGIAVVASLIRPVAEAPLRDIVDPETFAFNESFLVYRLRQEMSRTRRSSEPLVVGMIDVNHRQALDGLMPRARGEALRQIAALFDSHLRAEDVIARLDGTTFAVLMPDTTDQQAVAIIQAMRPRITSRALGRVNGAPVHANPAAGVVEYRDGALGDTQLLQQARAALHAASAGPVGRTEAFSSVTAPGTG